MDRAIGQGCAGGMCIYGDNLAVIKPTSDQ